MSNALILSIFVCLAIMGIVSWVIELKFIQPKLSEQYGDNFWRKIIVGPHRIKYLFRYRDICVKQGLSLKWFRLQMFLSTVGILAVIFIIVVAIIS